MISPASIYKVVCYSAPGTTPGRLTNQAIYEVRLARVGPDENTVERHNASLLLAHP